MGIFPGDFLSREATADSMMRFSKVDSRNRGPQGRMHRAEQKEETGKVWDPQPIRREDRRNSQREN